MNSYPSPILTVDIVPILLDQGTLRVGLQTRPNPPHAGDLALPGGFVHVDNDLSTRVAALRVLRAKTGLANVHVEQLATFSGPNRDPRGWSVSVVYIALISRDDMISAYNADLVWHPLGSHPPLAFDHDDIVATAADRIRSKASYSSLPAFFLDHHFTLAELRQTYECILGTTLNDSAFRRKINELDVLVPVRGEKSKATARPAQLYRLKQPALQTFDRTI